MASFPCHNIVYVALYTDKQSVHIWGATSWTHTDNSSGATYATVIIVTVVGVDPSAYVPWALHHVQQ